MHDVPPVRSTPAYHVVADALLEAAISLLHVQFAAGTPCRHEGLRPLVWIATCQRCRVRWDKTVSLADLAIEAGARPEPWYRALAHYRVRIRRDTVAVWSELLNDPEICRSRSLRGRPLRVFDGDNMSPRG